MPEFIVVKPKGGGSKFVIDRINLNDSLEEVGEPELRAGGPVSPKPHVSLTKASTAKADTTAGDTGSKKEG